MIEATARAAAYVAGRLATGEDAVAIVDQLSGVRSDFIGDVRPDRVFITDVETSCLVTGRSTGGGPLWLFHQDTMRYLTLITESAHVFTGLDYSTGHAFDALTSTDGSVELLDYETGRWRRYRLQLSTVLIR